MIRLERRQRDALSETLRELANLNAAALVVGQIVIAQPRLSLILAGIAFFARLRGLGALARRRTSMEGALLMVGGILLVVSIVVFLDWWGWRRERQSRDRAA